MELNKFATSFFGNNWKKKIIKLIIFFLILTFGVPALFINKIEFNPAAFAQDWIKTLLSISLLYLILEFQKFNYEKNKSKYQCKDILVFQIIKPLNNLVNLYEECRKNSDNLKILKRNWHDFYKRINTIDLYNYNVAFNSEIIYNFKFEYKIEEVNSFIATINSNTLSNEKISFEKYLDLLINLKEAFENEVKTL